VAVVVTPWTISAVWRSCDVSSEATLIRLIDSMESAECHRGCRYLRGQCRLEKLRCIFRSVVDEARRMKRRIPSPLSVEIVFECARNIHGPLRRNGRSPRSWRPRRSYRTTSFGISDSTARANGRRKVVPNHRFVSKVKRWIFGLFAVPAAAAESLLANPWSRQYSALKILRDRSTWTCIQPPPTPPTLWKEAWI
jgi:hypothetical protein